MKTIYLMPFFLLTSALAAPEDIEIFKRGCRLEVMERSETNTSKFRSPIREADRAENLIDEPLKMIRSLQVMDHNKLFAGKTAKTPWSDSYWPFYKGSLGQRYTDQKFIGSSWKDTFDYVHKNPADSLIAQGRWRELSPSEKYDILLNLSNMPLTTSSWNDGKGYWDRYGDVETWMGLCHGWAAASMMVEEPKKKVSLKSLTGDAIFYPSDIKGLATLLWSKGKFQTRFIGGRCNSKNPRTDSYGRPVENECLDTNPGTWHLAMVNQIGVSKRPLIMDANYDYEVWNHPVYEYSYSYFNPKTRKYTKSLSEALIKKSEWRDPKAKFRARETQYLVGVVMDVSYVVENEPTDEEDQMMATSETTFEYDLELNERFEIIGGEWSEGGHPDFLWVPVKNTFPETYNGASEQQFNFMNITELQKRSAAHNASNGLPWGPVVRYLLKLSSGQ